MEITDSNQEMRELDAKTVYLLMTQDYRISRNIRASWFFQHINTKITFNHDKSVVHNKEELIIVSVEPVQYEEFKEGATYNILLSPDTTVIFLARRYRLVFVLDLSPSIASVDISLGEVVISEVYQTLAKCLQGLVQPVIVPGSKFMFSPEIYITIIAHTPVLQGITNQVLSQGILVTAQNITAFLRRTKKQLEDIEHLLAFGFGKVLDMADKINRGHFDHSDDSIDLHQTAKPELLNKSEAGIVSLLRNGILALHLLPENSSAGIIVVTDGMVGVPDATVFESLLNQLRSATIACSFLKIGKDCSSTHQLGHIPHSELMQFISSATLGAYFASCPDMLADRGDTNPYHEALLMWSFQKDADSFQADFLSSRPEDIPFSATLFQSQLLAHPIKDRAASSVMPIIRKKHLDAKLNTNLASIMSVRLREGYIIKHVAITKGGSQIEVSMVLPWREYVRIEYQAMSSWPLDSNKRHTHVEIIIEGSYDFLHDITCTQLKTTRSPFRMANVKKFWMTLQGLSQTDQLLIHLQSFATNPVYYKLNESVKSGVPLFYLPQNSNTPVLNTQFNTKDSALNQFASFWKPVVNLDIKVWQKWMHAHRIGFVLEHDAPLPKYLHTPNSSGRFSSIQCRQAMTSLSLFLRDYSTFVLLENHSYIKVLMSEHDKPPTSFFLLRVTSKPPCIALRLAFLGGTRGSERHRIVQQLRDKVLALKFPKRGMQKDVKKRMMHSRSHIEPNKKPLHKPPLLRDWSEISCCVRLFKPVEHILIRYERKPRDMSVVEDPSKYIPSHMASQTYAANKSAANLFNVLSRYLHHHRWIWTVQQSTVQISMHAVSRILSTLAKIRLQEGFHFAVTNSGITNMVLEVEMMDDMNETVTETVPKKDAARTVVQYILFPPHIKTTRDSVSDEDLDEMETTEADGELQIVTECWMEPQHGLSINNTPERKKFDGLTYEQISRIFYEVDLECISSLVTFEYLVYLCQHNTIPLPLEIQQVSQERFIRESSTQVSEGQTNIHHTQFPFDLLYLVPRCQQAELLLSTYILVPGDHVQGANGVLFSLLLDQLKSTNEREITLSASDSQKFVQLLHERKRDVEKNPFPFSHGKDAQQTEVQKENHGKDPCTKRKVESDVRQGKMSALPLKTSSIGSTGDNSATENLHATRKYPIWKCYIKMVSAFRIFLTFIPASFSDLLILHEHEIPPFVGNVPLVSDEKIPEVVNSEQEENVSIESENKNAFVIEGESTELGELSTEPLPENIHGIKCNEQEDPSSENLPSKKTLAIPVYIYECNTHHINDSLVNPWGFQLPDDVFEDLTFELTPEILEENSTVLSPRFRFLSLEKEESAKEEMDSSPQAMRSSLERRSTEGSSDGGLDFQHHCTELTERYYSSFVKGVFQSLQQGLIVDKHDIESSVNNICEESLPLEVDITTFLMASCRHLQQTVQNATEQEDPVPVEEDPIVCIAEDSQTEGVRFSSVRFAQDMEEMEEYTSLKKITPSVLELPSIPVVVALPLLDLETSCEYLTGLHQLIQDKFRDIIQKWFQVVPSSPDFYFYCPELVPQNLSLEETEREADTTLFSEGQSDMNPVFEMSQNQMPIQSDHAECDKYSFPDDKPSGSDSASTVSNLDSEESFSDSEDSVQDNEQKNLSPLFMYFTCTVKSGLDQHNLCIRKLMPCLAEITKTLENTIDLDLSDMKITLDLNCLTLPMDDEPVSPRRPSFLRMISNASSIGSPPPSIDHDDEDDKRSLSPQKTFFGDPIGHLPALQRSAVMKCIEEISWLLRDEISSALRSVQPIHADALQMVTDHIQFSASHGKPTCCADEVPLQFVYGPENSLTRFAEDFERMNLPGYHLVKEGDFYYIVVDRAHCHTLAHARALNSALVKLTKDASSGKRPNRLPSAIGHRERASTIATINRNTRNADPLQSKDLAFSTRRKGSADLPFKSEQGSRKPSSSDSKSGKGSREHSFDSGQKVDLIKEPFDEPSKKSLEMPAEVQINVTKEGDFTLQTSYSERHLSYINKRVSCGGETDNFLEGPLKKSSSFAGFHTDESEQLCKPAGQNTAALSVSPIKLPPLGRFRHFSAPSGHGTPLSKPSTLPQSPSWFSSRGSYTEEEGYDGDSSNTDDNATEGSDMSGKQRLLPNFWLIMQLNANRVSIYFHTRDIDEMSYGVFGETGQEENEVRLEQRNLLSLVKTNIEKICLKVNQKLLLNDLYANRMCNALLVPKADEEETWNLDKTTSSGHQNTDAVDLSDDDNDSDDHVEKKYLAAAMNFHPGHFDCECVWRMYFSLHPRLKMAPGRSGVSRGLQALKTVLNQFSVNNRKNMFVIRENSGDHAVFYLRLKESVNISRQMSAMSGEDINLGDSFSSAMMLAARRDEEQFKPCEKDADNISITSSGSSSFTRCIQDKTEIQVFGIQPAGSEIKEDLRRILQNRLDDTVLDIISVTLSRNPMCKLMPEDVQFIQQPVHEPGQEPRLQPKDILCLTIPSFTQLQLPAMMFYLRQNLLQFLHVPKYVDSKPENHFQDIFSGHLESIPDSQVFLYIKPQASGGKGISCVSLSLVDGQKNLVRMLSCPKPSVTGCNHIHDKCEFDSLVYTSVYMPASKSKPGPTSLIQFRIWERGTGDLKRLREKLTNAVKHALCDIVMEYSLLTAPLCEVPHDLCDFTGPPTHSAPSSPSSPKVEVHMRERRHSTVTRKLSDSVKIATTSSSARHMTFSPSPFQSLKEALTPTKARYASPPPDLGKSFDLPSTSSQSATVTLDSSKASSQTKTENTQRQLVANYESGKRGNLHPAFMNLMPDWLDYCCELNVPSIQKTELHILSSFSLDYILHELNALVNSLISDVQIQYFLIQQEDLTGGVIGIPYLPLRKSHQSGDSRSSQSVDTALMKNRTVGSNDMFIVIGRNTNQWQNSVQRDIEDCGFEVQTPTGTKGTTPQTFQKFQPYFGLPSSEKNSELIGFVSSMEPLFIPRQRLLFTVVKNKKILFYTYNLAGDMNTMLIKLVTELVHWNNARSHLLYGIICQKMGLFHHRTFYEAPMGQENNQYIMPSTDIDHLIKYSSPPVRDQARRHSSLPTSSHAPVRPFDVIFKDYYPAKSLHHSQQRNIRDPVAKHGLQAQEIQSHYKKDMDKILKLHKLYWMWFQKTSPNLPISEEIIQLLKQSSRILHYSTTPILFCFSWRQRVIEKHSVHYRQEFTAPSPVTSDRIDSKSRSRHGSGTSVTSSRSKWVDTQDIKKRPPLATSDSVESCQSVKLPSEEPWHIQLRENFITQYIQYLSSLGFVHIQTRPASPKRGVLRNIKKSSDGKCTVEDDQSLVTSAVYNLQKTLSGGIMVLELGFRREYFCVKLYTCEFSRLGITVNQQIKLMFVDECEKCKTLIHVHSFAHDFHLRCIQDFLSGQQDLFKHGYHLTGFLADFLLVYPYPPSFSRNYLVEDSITIRNLTCPGHQLYDYMLKHVQQHNMRSVRMVPSLDADIDSDYYCVKWNEYALILHKVHPGTPKDEDPTKTKNDDYNVGLVIIQETLPDAERNSLHLRFFIVLTSRRELFPKMTLEKKLGEFKSSGTKEMLVSNRPVAVKQHIGVRQESLKYISKPIQQQAPLLFLNEEAQNARQKIQEMVEISTAKCRRDILWQRMLVGDQTEDDGKKKKRSDTEESRDGDLNRLSFEEFQELLSMVTRKPLQKIDPVFVSFLNLSLQWYQGLFRNLQTKYKEQNRTFTSPDGQLQYILILNPNWLDMFMMLVVDVHNNGRTDICAIFREQPVDQEHTPENPSLSVLSMQSHIEGFINTCCFHLWTAML